MTASHKLRAFKPLRQNSHLRLHDHLFADANPDAGGKEFLQSLKPDNLKLVMACVDSSLAGAQPDQKFQFERFRYFVASPVHHVAGAKPMFNRMKGLKDYWDE